VDFLILGQAFRALQKNEVKRPCSGVDFLILGQAFRALQKNEVKRPWEMEKENARLMGLLAEQDLEVDVVSEILKKSSLCDF
jgi:hypothetical protein